MGKLLALILFFSALPLSAGPDKESELYAALRSGTYPALLYFIDSTGGMTGDKASAFAASLPDSAAERAAELKTLDRLLRGGKYDKGGENIRREMAKLPGPQWRFVIRLEQERRAIYDRLGPGGIGNIYENTYGSLPGVKVEARLCFDRSDKLRAAMKPVQAGSAFGNWKSEDLGANHVNVRAPRNKLDELYNGVHHAACFIYDDGATRAEIVGDAWANSLTPSYTWWYVFDRATHDYLYKAGGRDWCSDEIQERSRKALVDARRAAERKNAPAATPKSATLNGLQGSGPF